MVGLTLRNATAFDVKYVYLSDGCVYGFCFGRFVRYAKNQTGEVINRRADIGPIFAHFAV